MPDSPPTIGLLLGNPADRRLLRQFLLEQGYRVLAPAPPEADLSAWGSVRLILSDAPSARQHAGALMRLKQHPQTPYLPLLIV
ncbi:MAG: hypothetical protein D6796_00665, partial [Caldilineae bacterium]